MTNASKKEALSGMVRNELGGSNSSKNSDDALDESSREPISRLQILTTARHAVNGPTHVSKDCIAILKRHEARLRHMAALEQESGGFTSGLSRCIDLLDMEVGDE